MPEITLLLLYEILLEQREELKLIRTEQHELKQILKILRKTAHPVTLFLKFKNKKMEQIKIGALLEGVLELDDEVTGSPVEATYSGDEASSSDDSIATVVVNADDPSKLDVTAVSPGAFTIHVKTTANYKDSNGDNASQQLEADSEEVTVEPAADGVSLKINFPTN